MQDSQDFQDTGNASRASSKILKAQDFEALANARQGIEQANTIAQGVIAAAHEEAATIRVAAHAGAEQDRAALVAEFSHRMQAQLAQVQGVLSDVVMSSLRRLIDPVPKDEQVAGAVACALRETDIAGGAVLIVAPPLMHTLREQFERMGISAEMIDVRGDPDCPLESSILRSAFGDVELGIEFQLRAIERGLKSAKTGDMG